MELTQSRLERLNTLLADRSLDLPDFRRSVNRSGGNLQWLQQHIRKRNSICDELAGLLGVASDGGWRGDGVKEPATARSTNAGTESPEARQG